MAWMPDDFAIYYDGPRKELHCLHIEWIEGDCAVGRDIMRGVNMRLELKRLEPVTEAHKATSLSSVAFGRMTLGRLIAAHSGDVMDDPANDD